MAKGKASGISLSNNDAALVLGMVQRDDRDHDIAAWFGVNQGRIAEVKAGSHGSIIPTPTEELPPKGPPGVKGRRLRLSIAKAIDALAIKGTDGVSEAIAIMQEAQKRYDSHET